MKRLRKRALLWLYQQQLIKAAWEDAYERTLEAQRKQMAEQARTLEAQLNTKLRGWRAQQSRDIGETTERRKRMN